MLRVIAALGAAAAGCGRIGFGAQTGDAGFAMDSTVFGDGVVAPSCGATTVFADGFDDGVAGPFFKTFTATGLTLTETASHLQIAFAPSVTPARYAGYETVQAYPSDGLCLVAEVVQLPVDRGVMYIKVRSSTEQFEFFAWAGLLDMRTHQGGLISAISKRPLDPVAQRFWRLREQGGTSSWDVSADGITYYSLASSTFFTDGPVIIELGAGVFEPNANAGTAIFDSVQLTTP